VCGRGCERVNVCGFVELQCARKEKKELSPVAALFKGGIVDRISAVARAMRIGASWVRYGCARSDLG
jgi:hypothetical protein